MLRFIFFILASLSFNSWATAIDELNPIETLDIAYDGFQQPMSFNVTLPQDYTSSQEKRYILVFDLHPRSQPYLSGLHDWLSHNGEWPWLGSIVVTPSSYHKEFSELFVQATKKPGDLELLNFIQDSVLKKIDQKYRTNGFRIFSGFMSNGAIGLYAMLNKPSMFNAYIISTPTLNDNFLNILETAPKKLPSLTDKIRFLYLTIGQHRYERAHISAVEKLAKLLSSSAPPELDWTVKTNEQSSYMTRPIYTLLAGIEQLFDDYHTSLPADSEVAQQGFDAIIRYYDKLSTQKYGFEVSAETSLKNLAESLLQSDPNKALEIYQEALQLYPNSAYGYASLAEAYFKLGNLEEAISQQLIATEKAKTMSSWHQNKIAKTLAKYRAELSSSK